MNAMLVVVVLVVGGPRDPSNPGWMPPTALSSSSGGRIKRVSLTGLTSSHPLHQSGGGQRSDQLDPHGPLSATGLNHLLTASETEMMRGGVSLSSS